MPSPLRRHAKPLAITALVLGIVVVLWPIGVAVYIRSLDPTIPFPIAIELGAEGTVAFFRCDVFECEIERPGGIEIELWAEDALVDGPPVAIAVAFGAKFTSVRVLPRTGVTSVGSRDPDHVVASASPPSPRRWRYIDRALRSEHVSSFVAWLAARWYWRRYCLTRLTMIHS